MEKLNKVAEVTLIFWFMKIVATTLGETLGDSIAMQMNLGYGVGLAITCAFLLVVLGIQLFSDRYVPVFYWFVIVATTTVGTEISDFIDRSLHIGYGFGSGILAAGLILTLALWFRRFGNMSVYPIYDRRKEIYYWVAILFSNSLGTAFGDYLSDNLGFEYLTGAAITATIILVVALIHYFTSVNGSALFWIAFVFTRPFGATFGDFLTKPLSDGGLDLGALNASIVSILVMAILIFVSHRRHVVKTAGLGLDD